MPAQNEDPAVLWEQLFIGLAEKSKMTNPDESDVGHLNSLLASVRLIQPFDWMKWQMGWPTLEEIEDLTLADCVRHITRLVRSERYREDEVVNGSMWQSLRSGKLEKYCRTAYLRSGGTIVPTFEEMERTK